MELTDQQRMLRAVERWAKRVAEDRRKERRLLAKAARSMMRSRRRSGRKRYAAVENG